MWPKSTKWGGQVQSAFRSIELTLDFLPAERDHSYCRALSRGEEHSSRQSVPGVQRFQQLEAQRKDIQNNPGEMGPIRHRSICGPLEQPTGEICQLETRSPCTADRCFSDELVRGERICVPSILSDQQVFGKSQNGTSHHGIGDPSMAGTSMVPANTGDVSRGAVIAPTISQFAVVPARRATSTITSGEFANGGLEGNRQPGNDNEISQQAEAIIRDAKRSGTQKAYDCSWRKWASWCHTRQIDPFQAPVGAVINFLSELFEQGMEYSSINGYRSAISASHIGWDGIKAGQHPKVCDLLKGMFNRRPPQPRYAETWEVNKVLDLFRSWPMEEGLDLKQLSLKLTMLMALTGAMRQSELSMIRSDQILDKGDLIQVMIGGLTKTR